MLQFEFEPSMRTGLFRLPPDITDFTGRGDAMLALRNLLESAERSTAAVVSAIAGRAGVGKTALATRVAHQLRDSFPGGQLYVNLRGPEVQRLKPEDVLAEFLLELGMPRAAIPDQLEDRARQYRARLEGRRILVVLDNAAEEAQVKPLLPGSPGSAVLITSRKRLPRLPEAHAVTLDVLEPGEGIDLLRKVVGGESLAAEPEAARRIVQLCAGLPLAVRIAGARFAATGELPLATLAGRLAAAHDALSRLGASDLEVRASFALTFEGLRPDERRTFRLLGLVRAPDFPPWVAAALLDSELAAAEKLLGDLAQADVLEVARTTATSDIRYRFHDVLRVLAREHLAAEEPRAAEEAALHRALEVSLGLVRQAAGLLEPGSSRSPVRQPVQARFSSVVDRLTVDPAAWLEGERILLTAAVDQAFQRRLWEMTWELARAQTYFFKLRTHWSDWRHAQLLAILAARCAQDRPALANALRSLGDVHTQAGRLPRAIARLGQARRLFGELGDRRGTAWTLVGLGNANREQGSFDEATVQFQEGRRLFAELGDRRGQGWALEGLGVLYRQQGKFTECLACFMEGLGYFRQVGDHRGQAYDLVNLGAVHRDRGQVERALHWFDEAQPIFRRLADRHGETFILLNRGHMLREQRRFEEADRVLRGCLHVFEQLSEQVGTAWTVWNLGMLLQAVGRLDEAAHELDRCRKLFAVLGDRRGTAWTLTGLGLVHLEEGDVHAALSEFQLAVPALRDVGDQLGLAKALSGHGSAMAASGDHQSAATLWREALQIFRRLEAPEASVVEARLPEPE